MSFFPLQAQAGTERETLQGTRAVGNKGKEMMKPERVGTGDALEQGTEVSRMVCKGRRKMSLCGWMGQGWECTGDRDPQDRLHQVRRWVARRCLGEEAAQHVSPGHRWARRVPHGYSRFPAGWSRPPASQPTANKCLHLLFPSAACLSGLGAAGLGVGRPRLLRCLGPDPHVHRGHPRDGERRPAWSHESRRVPRSPPLGPGPAPTGVP